MKFLGIVLAVVLVAGTIGSAAASDEAIQYVALGDSSASGPGIPNQIDQLCARSDRNWPHVLAGSLGATLTDVTCSSATTADLAGRQYGIVDPQFAKLHEDVDLVTLAIAANDIALAEAFITCGTPNGQTCQERFTVGGVDQFATRIEATAPKVAAALDTIHRESPQAEVFVVGYLTYWRQGGCYPTDPYTAVDADYIQSTFDRLMEMLAREAAQHNASYVDIRTPSAAHDVCAAPAQRWLEGAFPPPPAVSYHPNAAGMANAASIIGREIRR